MKIAKVLVDVPIRATDRLYDYEVPDSFQNVIEIGMRAIVPFGPRKVLGLVVDLKEETPSEYKIKPISNIPDIEPVLTDELIRVGFWLSRQTHCLTISAFQAMLPAALKANYKKEIRFHPDYSENLPEQLISLFSGNKTWYWRELTVRHPDQIPAVRRGVREGILQVIQHVKDQSSQKSELMVAPAGSRQMLMEARNALRANAEKQRQVLSYFIDHLKPVPLKTLLDTLNIGRSSVKSLVHKGVLFEEPREVYRDPYQDRELYKSDPLPLTAEQQAAMSEITIAIKNDTHETILLHGVTGSGKTEIYLQAIDHVLKKGKEAIVLVPEIALTPQMVERFKSRFGSHVAVLHSGLSQGEKYDEWRKIRRKEVHVAVGARSAIFAPFTKLGLVIIDEEHETSYKQEEQPRYHARDVAIYRAFLHKCPVVLGSATPSFETYARAEKGAYRLSTLKERINQKEMPHVELVDMREELRSENRSMFSTQLFEKLEERLEKGEQSILFLNRRGFSTFMICRDCGYVSECPHCDISLTYHKKTGALKCHYCGYQQAVPKDCPSCSSSHIRFFGTGTQRVEEELGKVLPEARVIRMDVDTTSRKGMHEKYLRQFTDGKADILLGTQMIAKGLDFPNVTLVGILAADMMLHLPDFRASERTFQLLTQVSGRAGRRQLTGEVVIQTYSPEHYSITLAARHDYLSFYQKEMMERKQHRYPPYYFLTLVTVSDPDVMKTASTAKKITAFLKNGLSSRAVILGPVAAAIPRIKDRYRYQCMVKYKREPDLLDVLSQIQQHYGSERSGDNLRINIDMNPQMMM